MRDACSRKCCQGGRTLASAWRGECSARIRTCAWVGFGPVSAGEVRFRSIGNRFLVAVYLCSLALCGGFVVLFVGALVAPDSSEAPIYVAAIASVCAVVLIAVRASRVGLLYDAANQTLTVTNVWSKHNFDVNEIAAVRVVPYPAKRSRRGRGRNVPSIEVRLRDEQRCHLLATAIESERSRLAAWNFLQTTRAPLWPNRREYVDGAYVPQQWTERRYSARHPHTRTGPKGER